MVSEVATMLRMMNLLHRHAKSSHQYWLSGQNCMPLPVNPQPQYLAIAHLRAHPRHKQDVDQHYSALFYINTHNIQANHSWSSLSSCIVISFFLSMPSNEQVVATRTMSFYVLLPVTKSIWPICYLSTKTTMIATAWNSRWMDHISLSFSFSLALSLLFSLFSPSFASLAFRQCQGSRIYMMRWQEIYSVHAYTIFCAFPFFLNATLKSLPLAYLLTFGDYLA